MIKEALLSWEGWVAPSEVSGDILAVQRGDPGAFASLRALPTPQPPAELVARVCRLGETSLELQRAPRNGAAFLAPLVAASWVAALATWPLVRAAFQWLFGGWHGPSGGLGGTLAAYSTLGFILACASALAVGVHAREIGRSK